MMKKLKRMISDVTVKYLDTRSMLEEIVDVIKKDSGVAAVGIRLLARDGAIMYAAQSGFTDEFFYDECPLNIFSHKCMCIYVIEGSVDKSQPFISEYGSFFSFNTIKLLASATDEEKGVTRNRCNIEGYETVVLIPIKSNGNIIGLIHMADYKVNALDEAYLKKIERITHNIGTSLWRSSQLTRLTESLNQTAKAKASIRGECETEW